MDPHAISELAQLFRQRGDSILDGEIKFSVTGKQLKKFVVVCYQI